MKLLIVDDDFVCKTMMTSICKQIGECQAVENGEDALTAYRNAVTAGQPFDLITLDKSLPDLDGIDVLLQIRETEAAKGIPAEARVKIIMVTATADDDVIESCSRAGCDDYIIKPFRRVAVTEKIKSHLESAVD
jgi:two-component system chemotaxis response regulator CheY